MNKTQHLVFQGYVYWGTHINELLGMAQCGEAQKSSAAMCIQLGAVINGNEDLEDGVGDNRNLGRGIAIQAEGTACTKPQRRVIRVHLFQRLPLFSIILN